MKKSVSCLAPLEMRDTKHRSKENESMNRKLSGWLNFRMRIRFYKRSQNSSVFRAAFCALATALLAMPSQAQYRQRNIVSDIPGLAELLDANLKNPWGASHSATGPI